MAEWAFNIATMEYDCPKCGAKKGENCRTPQGRICRTPHGDRVHQLSKKDWDRCRGQALTANQALGKFLIPTPTP